MGLRTIGLSTISERHVLGYLAEDLDLCERLAKELEIDIDAGESAGAYLQDTCQRMMHEDKISNAEQRLERLRSQAEGG